MDRKTTGGRGAGRVMGFATAGAFVAALIGSVPDSRAASVTAVGGYDHYRGAFGQVTDGAIAAVVFGLGNGDLTVAGTRYDDTNIGAGYGMTGGFGAAMAPALWLRGSATRFVGDETFRAWRAKVGPELRFAGGRWLLFSYAHYTANARGTSDGVVAEGATPLVPGWTGKASASWATAVSGPPALQGSAGLSWSPIRHLEIAGELGVARNASGSSALPYPGRGPLSGLPLVGGSGSETSSGSVNDFAATAQIGVRASLP